MADPLYGGFWRRVGATVIDGIIVNVPLHVLGWLSPGLLYQTFEMPEEMAGETFTTISPQGLAISVLAWWLYEALMTSSRQQATVGKMAANLVVTDRGGARLSFIHASGRHFAKYLSTLFFGFGMLMVAFTRRKQGLHDKLAGTLVIEPDIDTPRRDAGF